MADNVTAEAVVTPGAVFATDDDGVAQHPYVKLEWGADNTFTKVASGAGALPIQDGGNSITVDNAALSVTGGGVEATAVRVTVASDSTGVLSVDDNGGSLTVDGSVTITQGGNDVQVGSNGRLKVETAAKTSDDQPYGVGTDDGYPLFALANDTTPDSVNEGDAGIVRMSLNRNIYTQIRDGSAERSAEVTAGNALKTDGSSVTQPVSATSLPLPTGATTEATLVAIAASASVLDDWDESDRAKVNLIAGQAGVAAGVGASGATTQRVVLADSYGKTIKKAVVSLTASGNIVAAVASKSIRMFEIAAQSRNDSMTLQVTDGSGGAALSLRWAFNTREGVSRIINPPAWLAKTTDNTALYATITGTGTIDIEVSYWDDDAA